MFILAAQRAGSAEACANAFRRYEAYLAEHRERFPPAAYQLATSSWFYDFRDHRCPHDAWLEAVTIEEPSAGARHENRTVAIRVRLLGAYHDGRIELYYPAVYRYRLQLDSADRGHREWRFDEFRLTADGHLVHEIEWAGPSETAHWLIQASDLEFTWRPEERADADIRESLGAGRGPEQEKVRSEKGESGR